MAAYKVGNTIYSDSGNVVYNSNDVTEFLSSDDSVIQGIIDTLTTFVKKVGDTMGYLNVSTIGIYGNTGSDIVFSDGTIQNTAYTGTNKDIEAETIEFTETINGITTANFENINLITNINDKTQNVSKTGTLTTISGNTHLNSFTAGNINTSHLNNTTSNVQTQLTALQTKTNNITFNSGTGLTTIGGTSYFNSFTAGNINTAHLSATSSNLQNQMNTANSNIASNTANIATITTNNTTNTTNIATNTTDITTLNQKTQYITSNNNWETNIGGSIITGNVYAGGIVNATNFTATGDMTAGDKITCERLEVAGSDITALLNTAKSYVEYYTLEDNILIGQNVELLNAGITYYDTYVTKSYDFINTSSNFFYSTGMFKPAKYLVTLSYNLYEFSSMKKLLVRFSLVRKTKSTGLETSQYFSLRSGFESRNSETYTNYGGQNIGVFTVPSSTTFDYFLSISVDCDIYTSVYHGLVPTSHIKGQLMITEIY